MQYWKKYNVLTVEVFLYIICPSWSKWTYFWSRALPSILHIAGVVVEWKSVLITTNDPDCKINKEYCLGPKCAKKCSLHTIYLSWIFLVLLTENSFGSLLAAISFLLFFTFAGAFGFMSGLFVEVNGWSFFFCMFPILFPFFLFGPLSGRSSSLSRFSSSSLVVIISVNLVCFPWSLLERLLS